MFFKSLTLKEGMFIRTFNFDPHANLIHSTLNSTGKTTLLRFMLYALGYNIPSTRNIKFEQCEVECTVVVDGEEFVILRYNAGFLIVYHNGDERTYYLPNDLHSFHSILFKTSNPKVLDNILGAFYLDQEKGWTLLNRGKVIGSIHFSIEELVRGLSGRNCDELIVRESRLKRDRAKYKQLFNISEYRNEVLAENGGLIAEDFAGSRTIELDTLLLEEAQLKKELKSLKGSIRDSDAVARFIEEMRITVLDSLGNPIPVTLENIVGFSDNVDYLHARRKILEGDLSDLNRKIKHLRNIELKESEQESFYQSDRLLDVFDRRLAGLPIDSIAIQREIRYLDNEIKKIDDELSALTKQSNDIVSAMHEHILRYAHELSLERFNDFRATYLFTSNLKELSGAVLHKTVFAFRLAFILEIEKALGIKLPIILDSPTGKEIDRRNVQIMMDILRRDFSENQIIIASIYEYDFNHLNTIEINDHLIE